MSTTLRALIVEDSEDDRELVLRELRRGGYSVTYEQVQTAPALHAALAERQWDIIIADFSMPQFDALAALKTVNGFQLDIPFIIVSGSIGEETAVAAMRAGAHDYLMKDNLARLVPVVERELREAETRREHRQAEESLQQSEERYRYLAD